MHTEHKTLQKWCVVLMALIIGVAAVSMTAFRTAPVSAPVTVEIETADAAAIKQMPDEMAELSSEHDITVLDEQAGKQSAADGEHDVQDKDDSKQLAQGQLSSASPVKVTLAVDGYEMKLLAAPVTVGKVLESYGIPVGKDDIVTPAADQTLTEDTKITVQRIIFEEIVKSEEVPFKVKVKGTDDLPAGTKKVVQKGKKGEDKVTYKVTYADGKEISRKEIDRERVKKPVTKIIAKSTVGTIEGAEYSSKFTVKAYSYTGGGTTASGLPAAVGRIAVDPSVIPLGTRVYVEGYGFATAADTGGNINGKTIDVYYNSESQCRNWGCRYITVYILK